jgi:hypothetical protein
MVNTETMMFKNLCVQRIGCTAPSPMVHNLLFPLKQQGKLPFPHETHISLSVTYPMMSRDNAAVYPHKIAGLVPK